MALDHKMETLTMGIDSGAAVTVIPEHSAPDYPLMSTAQSRAGGGYSSAGGHFIKDQGSRSLLTQQSDGMVRGLRARVCKVQKGLMSVYDMVQAGNRVVFDSGGSYAIHKTTGKRVNFVERKRVYEVDLNVVPHSQASSVIPQSSFQRQGNP